MKRIVVVTAAVSAVLLAGAVTRLEAPGSAGAASLSSLALTRSDVPAGYKQTKAKADTIQSTASDAKVSVAALRKQGWVAGYTSNFQKSTKTAFSEIDSGFSKFKSASGARWDLTQGTQAIERQFPSARTFAVSGIGDQALGLRVTGKTKGTPYAIVGVFFIRGAYTSGDTITAVGALPVPSVSEVERYAKILDGRLKHA